MMALDPRAIDLQTLPDQHTDFPFQVTLEAWWPFVMLACIVGVATFAYRRRRTW